MKLLRSALLGLALFAGAALAPTQAHAGNIMLSVSTTTGAGGTLLSQGWEGNTSLYPPTTYTARSTVGAALPGQGVGFLATKVWGYTATSYTAASWALWDCPNGLTYAAGARLVYQGYIPANSTQQNGLLADFTTQASARTDDDGAVFRYFPVWIDNGTNTIVATVQGRPFSAPTQSGAAK